MWQRESYLSKQKGFVKLAVDIEKWLERTIESIFFYKKEVSNILQDLIWFNF